MRYNKRKKFCIKCLFLQKLRLKHRIFAFFIIFILLFYAYIRYIATPVIVSNTKAQIGNYATRSINYAIADTMNQNIGYGELVKIVSDESGNVSFIEANSVRINLLSKTMSKVVMSNFLKFVKNPLKISLGSFSGISILSGLGPKIAYVVNPYGEVYCYFTSNFDSAGINQTYHKIYLVISMKISVVFPTKTLVVNSSSEVLLCETLIVGKIPDVYLNSDSLTDMINLVPERFNS